MVPTCVFSLALKGVAGFREETVVTSVVKLGPIGVVGPLVGSVPVQGRVINPITAVWSVTTPTISIKLDGSMSSGISSF